MLNRTLLILILLFMARFAAGASDVNRIVLPLSPNGSQVERRIDARFAIKVIAIGNGWDVEVTRKSNARHPYNLLYHSREWHGPYPSQVMAWHVAESYFPNTRWFCVQGQPIEVMIQLVNPEIEGTGDDAVFVDGKLIVAWYHRPCRRGRH